MGDLMWIGITSKEGSNLSPRDLRSLADWTLRPELLKVKGISNVLIQGGELKELRIELNQNKLNNYHLSFDEVVDKLNGAFNNTAGGILTSQGQEYPIRVMSPFINPIEHAGKILIDKSADENVSLDQIAKVFYADSPVRGAATISGKDGVILRVYKQSDVETISLTKTVDEKIAELKNSLPEGVELHSNLFRQESFISVGLSNVERALVESAIMVLVITFLFLMSWRATVVTIVTIPISILIAFIIFKLLGLSINVMTLGGLAVAVGELVDDAIIGVENSLRYFADKKYKEIPISKLIIAAISEVRGSIVYATILVAIVFVPILFIPGIEGKLLAPLGFAYIISLLASLLVSVTISPVLIKLFYKNKLDEFKNETHESKISKIIKEKIIVYVSKVLDFPKQVFVLTLFSILITVTIYSFAGKEGIPPFNEGSFSVNILKPVGTDLQTTKEFTRTVSLDLQKIDGVEIVGGITGRAGNDPHDSGSNQSEIAIVFKKDDEKNSKERTTLIQEKLRNFEGEATFSVGQPITHRVEELLSGVRAPIAIKVFGTDLEKMDILATEIASDLSKENGVNNVSIKKATEIPEFKIFLNPNKLLNNGIYANEYLEEFERSFIGLKVGEERKENERIPIVARLETKLLNDVKSIQDVSIDNTDLNAIADTKITNGRNRINHEGGKRFITISANYNGSDIVGAVQNIVDKYKDKKLDTGLSISYEGNYKSQKESSKTLAIAFIVVLILMFYVLKYLFTDSKLVAIVMLNIPTAFLGSMIFILLTGNSLNLAHIVGFISLSGIVARNGIMLISKIKDKEDAEPGYMSDKYLLEAVGERITPVLITSLVTGLALIPLILVSDAPGKEMLYPLAIVLVGGLITSTVTSFFITPALYKLFVRKN
jgi:HME family heavy-metal exporter